MNWGYNGLSICFTSFSAISDYFLGVDRCSKFLFRLKLSRMVYVGRDLCMSSSPAPLLRAGPASKLDHVAQDLVDSDSEISEDGRFHSTLGACSSA